MSKLNKIFFGPAGTGKTREATIEAVRIISESEELKNSKVDIKNYGNILEKLKDFSKTTELKTTDKKVFEEINNLNNSTFAPKKSINSMATYMN